MTGNTTQIMIDLVDLLRGLGPERSDSTRSRFVRMSASIIGFAAGCAAAALLYAFVNVWCFLGPPVLGFLAIVVRDKAARRAA